MEIVDQEKVKVKEKLRNLFALPIQTLEDKFLEDINKLEIMKSNLYESIYENDLICEIYKKQFIHKIELKKHNSAGHIISSQVKVNSLKKTNNDKNKTPSKYQIQDEILLTPTSNIKSGDNSTENTKKLIVNNAVKNLKDNKDDRKKNNYSPLPIFNKKNQQYILHLSYIENNKSDNSKVKEDNSKSTTTSIPKKINNNRMINRVASTHKSKLNSSVEIAFSSKNTRPTNNTKQKVGENLRTKILSNPKSLKLVVSGSIIANTVFSNKKIRTLAILCVNAAIPLDKRLNLMFSSKELYEKIDILKPLLIESRIKEYERKVILLEEKLNSYKNDDILQGYINKGFIPSKTAQNSLNFLTKDDENNLNKQCNLEQIQNLFKLIYILLNEDYESISPQELISNLLSNILLKYKVESLKSLFLNYLIRVFFYSDLQIEKFTMILNQNPKLLSSHELLKISKPLSFFSFILKEIYEYANLKADDGTSVLILRKVKIKLDHYKLKIQELKKNHNISIF